jgi:protein TonB
MNSTLLGRASGISSGDSSGFGPRDKAIGFATVISLLIHGACLGWLPGLGKPGSEVRPTLRINFLEPPTRHSPLAVPPARAEDQPREIHREADQSRLAALPVLTKAVTRDWQDPAPVHAAESFAASSDEAVRPDPAPTTARSQPFDADLLAAYGRELTGAVARHQRYPRLALLRQWQGNALLRLEFGPDSRLLAVRVLSSSGYEALDQQALEMVRDASPLPQLPVALAGRAVSVDVPVVFRIAS